MIVKYKNKFRIESTRIPHWDYSRVGSYFITICTAHRQPFFGMIGDGTMHNSQMGIVAKAEWYKTPELRPDLHLELGEFTILPDHVHGIIHIRENQFNSARAFENEESRHDPSSAVGNHFGPQRKNLSSIIRGYKSAVTMYARVHSIPFDWQSGFYEKIIQNERELYSISNYIVQNVQRWSQKREKR